MNVLAIYSSDEILGGGEISFTLSLEQIARCGWTVLAAVPETGKLSSFLEARGIPFVVLPQPKMRSSLNMRYLFRPHPEWVALCKDFHPDLIHCNAIRPALYAQAVARALRVPAILHARISTRLTAVDLFLSARLSAIICTSEVVRRRFLLHPVTNKFRVVHNAVDLASFETPSSYSGELRKKWLGNRFSHLVGIPGRMSPIKGQHRLVSAAPSILREMPETRFILIGSEDSSCPGYVQRLRMEIQRNFLEDHFVFAGFESDIASAYHALDIVVFPTSEEGFGRVAIEAGAARRALVMSDLEVLREIMPDDLRYLMVPLNRPADLSDRITRVLRDDRLRAEVGEQLYRHVISHFGIESHVKQLLSVYDEAMGRSRPSNKHTLA